MERWSSAWASQRPHPYEGPVTEFAPLMARFLPARPGLSFLELGCAPGFILTYFAKEFGYLVHGVDASPEGIAIARAHAALNGIEPDLRVDDLFTVDFGRTFDVVYSSGLIEHFSDPMPVIRRHVDLLRPGGTLVLAFPNLRGIHGLMFPTFDPVAYQGHNPWICTPGGARSAIRRVHPHWAVLYAGYWVTFRCFYHVPWLASQAIRAFNRGLRALQLDRLGNRLLSPYGYLIARRR